MTLRWTLRQSSPVASLAAATLLAILAAGCSGSGSQPAAPAPGSPAAAAPAGAQPAPAAPTAAAPAELALDLGGGATMKMVLIPAGKFMMGSPDSAQGRINFEVPQHEVILSKPFYMGVTEVTQAQYQAVMGKNPSEFKGATNPVEGLSWEDATEFCKKLSEKTRQTVRLPTEAEWEYACRAGTESAFSFGDDLSALGDYAWWAGNSDKTTHPVGQKKPNSWGLYDMHGNVLEWCADWYGEYPKGPATDPSGPATGDRRVLRGGGVGPQRYRRPSMCVSRQRRPVVPRQLRWFSLCCDSSLTCALWLLRPLLLPGPYYAPSGVLCPGEGREWR